jgi:PAS domain S-box-containing protein
VLESVLQLDCIDAGAVYLSDPANNSLDLIVHRGVSAKFAESVSHFSADSPLLSLLMDGDVRSGRFPENIQELKGVRETEGLCSYASFPMISQGQLIAVLNVASHRESYIPDDTLKSLENLTIQISGTILRLRTDAALRESEELFRSFVLQSKDGIVIVDEKGTIIEWNEGQEKITGIPRSEALNRPIWEVQFRVFPPENKNQEYLGIVRQKTLDGLKEGSGLKRSLEEEIQLADGTRRIIQTILFGIPGKRNVLAGAICRDISEQKRAEKENKILLQKNIILLKEVHHRIKNNISTIEGLLSLHARSSMNPDALSILQDAVRRVRSMSILYDNLKISENYSDVSSRSYFENLVDTIIDIFPHAAEISITRDIKDFIVSSKYIIPLGIIVNELITNALKHAFTGREDGILEIMLDSDGKKITLTIADNGKGLPSGFDIERENGFGFILVGFLVRQIDGTLSIDCEKGIKIRIECPI